MLSPFIEDTINRRILDSILSKYEMIIEYFYLDALMPFIILNATQLYYVLEANDHF
jgi:hypothetical protein